MACLPFQENFGNILENMIQICTFGEVNNMKYRSRFVRFFMIIHDFFFFLFSQQIGNVAQFNLPNEFLLHAKVFLWNIPKDKLIIIIIKSSSINYQDALPTISKWSIFFTILTIAWLSQSLWTTTPKNFYHPNQMSIRCVV